MQMIPHGCIRLNKICARIVSETYKRTCTQVCVMVFEQSAFDRLDAPCCLKTTAERRVDRGESDNMALVDLMRTVGLFSGLTDEQLQRLIAISQEETYDDGQIIFQQNTEGDKLYLIRDGQVEIRIQKRPHTPERSQVFLGRGQIFGEMALLDRGKRSATVRCSRDRTILHSISRDDFTALCNSDTAIGYVIMRNLAMDLSFKLRHRNLDLGADSQ